MTRSCGWDVHNFGVSDTAFVVSSYLGTGIRAHIVKHLFRTVSFSTGGQGDFSSSVTICRGVFFPLLATMFYNKCE